MTVIQRNRERKKKTAEFFTPVTLTDEMLSKLPDESWLPEKTFLDNSAGDGNLLVRILTWKVNKGSTVEQALSTIYGVDFMADNVARCRERLLEIADVLDPTISTMNEAQSKYGHIVERNIVCHDALTYHYRFDETNDLSRGGTPYDPKANVTVDKFFGDD